MARRNLAGMVAVVFGATALVTCSDQTPVTPPIDRAPSADVLIAARPVPGSYELSFFANSLPPQPVTSLPVFRDLILGARVADASGVPAEGGLVTFQYCSLKGSRRNGIYRPDEAPSAACATQEATWANLVSVPVDGSGNAYMNFGSVSTPKNVGFRFRYIGQGSGITNGASAPLDFTWVPMPPPPPGAPPPPPPPPPCVPTPRNPCPDAAGGHGS